MKIKLLLSVTLFFLFVTNVQAQTRIYVQAGASGPHTGTSWATAFSDLSMAIAAANAGDSIWVAKGTYFPTVILGASTDPRDKSFLLKDSVRLFGGFAGTESTIADRVDASIHTTNATILNGNIGLPDSSDNCYHVVLTLNSTTTVWMNGLIIRNGNANGTGINTIGTNIVPRNVGGGILVLSSRTNFRKIWIDSNFASLGGGGIYMNASNTILRESTILNNKIEGSDTTSGGGAGMLNVNSDGSISNVIFESNTAKQTQGGGALRNENTTTSFRNITFKLNRAEGGIGGGAVYNSGSEPYFDNCYFGFNTTSGQGGGMYNFNSPTLLSRGMFLGNLAFSGAGAMKIDSSIDVYLDNISFIENSTPGDGGAVQNWKSKTSFHGVTFTRNAAGKNGGAVFNNNTCSTEIGYCTFNSNIATIDGGALINKRNSNAIISNTIFTRNEAGNMGGALSNTAKDLSGAEPSSVVLTNVSIANNVAGMSGGGGFDDGFGPTLLRNSIISGNFATGGGENDVDAPATHAAAALHHSIVGDMFYKTAGDLPVSVSGDIFLDTLANDFRLAKLSMAINIGDSSVYASSAIPNLSWMKGDLVGAVRIMGDNVDLGAYEVCNDTLIPSVTLTVSPDTSVFEGTAVTFTATAIDAGSPIYQWKRNGVIIPFAYLNTLTIYAGSDFINGDTITVTVIPKSISTCTVADTVFSNPIIMEVLPYLSIKELIEKNNEIEIYPNPNSGTFTIKSKQSSSKDFLINILDLTGRIIYTDHFKGNAKTINVGGKTPSGTYMLSIENADLPKVVKRFVIQ